MKIGVVHPSEGVAKSYYTGKHYEYILVDDFETESKKKTENAKKWLDEALQQYQTSHYERLEKEKMSNHSTDALAYGLASNTSGTTWIVDAKDFVNSKFPYSVQAVPNQFQYIPPNLTTPTLTTPQKMPNLTRLTTSGDWTIALNEHNKLVAFNSLGQSVTAVGSLIYCDGRAWMWNGKKLWSGVMEHVEGEAEKRQREIDEENERKIQRRAKIAEAYNKRIEALQLKKYRAMDNIKK